MYEVINYPQFDIDCRNDGEVDCEPNVFDFHESCQADVNVLSVGSLTSDDHLIVGFHSLPAEVLLHLLRYIDDPFDIVSISGVNQRLYSFVKQNATSLSRQQLSTVELRGVLDPETEETSVIMNFTGTYYGSKRLWKGLRFPGTTITDIDIEMFSSKLMFQEHCTVRLDAVSFTKECLPSFTRFINELIKIDYPGYRRSVDFELQLNNCDFTNASRKAVSMFINKMIDVGCSSLVINSVAFEDYSKVCRALSESKLHLLEIFRFHSDDITPYRTDTLKFLFKPFCRLNRKTTRIVIDGIQIPLELCEWVMVKFCCTPFYTSPPPALRIVLSIHRNYTRQELFDMLKGVRSGVEEARSCLRHRLNHVYLELGMYESDVYLTQHQHCVVDVKLMKPKEKAPIQTAT